MITDLTEGDRSATRFFLKSPATIADTTGMRQQKIKHGREIAQESDAELNERFNDTEGLDRILADLEDQADAEDVEQWDTANEL